MNRFLLGTFIFITTSLFAQQPSSRILHDIQGLDKLQRFLYIAAHPDDENTRVIAWLNNSSQTSTAYLSLTRGDGGQNLIGDELGAELGLIRTNELLKARSIDGGSQFFSRAVDFGYSKTARETFKMWGKDAVLSDVVRVIRKFRPDVIITRFPPDERAGHGHHTASAILAIEAMKLAGDPEAFPEQLAQGLTTWTPRSVYWNASVWWNPDLDSIARVDPRTLEYEIGGYDPLIGLSYNELGSVARCQHKSQGFGTLIDRGSSKEYFQFLSGERLDNGFFLDNEELKRREGWNNEWSGMIRDILESYDPSHPERSVPQLIQLRKELAMWENPNLKQEKLDQVDDIIMDCLGLYFEALVSDPYLIQGEEVVIDFRALIRTKGMDVKVSDIRVNDNIGPAEQGSPLAYNVYLDRKVRYRADLPISMPFWLRKPYNTLFQVEDPKNIGLPVLPPDVRVHGTLWVNGVRIPIEVPVEYKWGDRVKGEQRRDLLISPGATASFQDPMRVFPDDKPREVNVVVHSFSKGFSGNLRLEVPEDWSVKPDMIAVDIPDVGGEKTFSFMVTPPRETRVSKVQAVWHSGQKSTVAREMNLIEYDHIPHLTLFPESDCSLVRIQGDRDLGSIGYVPGAGDGVVDGLRQLGYQITLIEESNFSQIDLSRYSTIIVGIRAFNVHPWLVSGKERLMQYVEDGGNLIVQYNTSGRRDSKMDLGPYPFEISRKRVTEEDAKVSFIDPRHPLLNDPNKITQADFEGWVQERGLYFADEWDDRYTPILSWHDTDEPPLLGGLLVAHYGKGTFIYTGISFFREIPAGVPGAYRLLINMISYE